MVPVEVGLAEQIHPAWQAPGGICQQLQEVWEQLLLRLEGCYQGHPCLRRLPQFVEYPPNDVNRRVGIHL